MSTTVPSQATEEKKAGILRQSYSPQEIERIRAEVVRVISLGSRHDSVERGQEREVIVLHKKRRGRHLQENTTVYGKKSSLKKGKKATGLFSKNFQKSRPVFTSLRADDIRDTIHGHAQHDGPIGLKQKTVFLLFVVFVVYAVLVVLALRES